MEGFRIMDDGTKLFELTTFIRDLYYDVVGKHGSDEEIARWVSEHVKANKNIIVNWE
jgi:hypothetical protein